MIGVGLRKKKLPITFFILLILIALGIFAPLLPIADPNQQTLSRRFLEPFKSASNVLGTDQLGRDILSRIIFGSRVSLLVAFSAVFIGGVIGVLFGALAGFFGGRIDDLISWLINVQLSFPVVLLAVAVVAVIGGGLLNIIVILGITSWVRYARVVRAEVMSLRERDFVQAAKALGQKNLKIITTHILPNCFGPVIIVATFEMARMIIMESALSFLGVGVQKGIPAWGNMLADGRDYLPIAWWVATFPGFAITIMVLCINLFGDWVRVRFDPKAN